MAARLQKCGNFLINRVRKEVAVDVPAEEKYEKVRPALAARFNYKNILEVPRLKRSLSTWALARPRITSFGCRRK